MAKGTLSPLFANLSGRLGREFIIKQYGDKIVISRYPKKSRRPDTEIRALNEGLFAEAIKYAQSIICNPELKKKYQARVKPGQRVYNYAISEYMKLAKSCQIPSRIVKESTEG